MHRSGTSMKTAELQQSSRLRSQTDAKEIGPGSVCRTGVGYGGGVVWSKAFLIEIQPMKMRDFCDSWC